MQRDDIDPDVLAEMLDDGFLEAAAIGPAGEILIRVSQKGRDLVERHRRFDVLGSIEPVVDGTGEASYRVTAEPEALAELRQELVAFEELAEKSTPEMREERLARKKLERFRAKEPGGGGHRAADKQLEISHVVPHADFPDDKPLYVLQNETGMVAFTIVKEGSRKTFELGFTSLERAEGFTKKATQPTGPRRVVRILQVPMKTYLSRTKYAVALDVDPHLLADLHKNGTAAGSSVAFTILSPIGPGA